MTWAMKRQMLYVAILLVFFSVFAFLIIYPKVNKAPTCFDGRQNGTEEGVDCGGGCQLLCTLKVDDISILWSRAFKVVHGRYNAVAYLENQNRNAVVSKINYRFRFADENNIYIGKREGSAYIPPSGKFAIFEPAIDLGNSIPVYTTFEFTQAPVWVRAPEATINQVKINISDIKLEGEDTSPKLSATLKNTSLFRIPELNVIAILYGASGNVVSASRTYVDVLSGAESAQVNFTWPEPFSEKVVANEIIPIFDIFKVILD